jgi:hypothetical protein
VIAGRRADWHGVALDPAVRPRALSEAELASLRDNAPSVSLWVAATHRPRRVAGEIAKDPDGAVVAGHLDIEGETPFPEAPVTFRVELGVTAEPLPEGVSFELPAERLPESRERPWRMIEDVLGEGLLPPYRPP